MIQFDEPGDKGAFADAVARGRRHAQRVDHIDAVESARRDFAADVAQKLGLPLIRTGFARKLAAGLAPGISEPDEAERVGIVAADLVRPVQFR